MADIGLNFNEKKCAIAHAKREVLDSHPNSTHVGESEIIENLKEGENYKCLKVLENSRQEDTLVLGGASKLFLQRLSVVWPSPLSDYHKVVASNQYALPVLMYPMWAQSWPIVELQQLDRESDGFTLPTQKARRKRSQVSRGNVQECQGEDCN